MEKNIELIGHNGLATHTINLSKSSLESQLKEQGIFALIYTAPKEAKEKPMGCTDCEHQFKIFENFKFCPFCGTPRPTEKVESCSKCGQEIKNA